MKGINLLVRVYRILILPYSIVLLYLMFIGFGREPHRYNIVRLVPILSTIDFIQNTNSWQSLVINLGGNIIMFVPFGFLAWLHPKYQNFWVLIIDFLLVLLLVEFAQYFTRLGVFDIDDFIFNTAGVWVGFQLRKILEKMSY